jgi:hypothetical protein
MSKQISYTKKGPGRVSGNKAGVSGYAMDKNSGEFLGRLPKGKGTVGNKIRKKCRTNSLGVKNSSGYKA